MGIVVCLFSLLYYGSLPLWLSIVFGVFFDGASWCNAVPSLLVLVFHISWMCSFPQCCAFFLAVCFSYRFVPSSVCMWFGVI